ncbi:1196_t:CDS:2 [Funneliformis geosporum]|uniref:1196_t:CDS:1 n=1 Tax=Funneliformis geosporum TaxID=1117311 RepID=A0A9W4WM20_9GLOM|nr:1196_t:CDS:2 [Funneliformis geosporum]
MERCDECNQQLEGKWCNNCDAYKFLEESKTIGYHKELHKLTKKERFQFRRYGICPNCKQLKVDYELCHECDKSYSECNKCRRPYVASGEEWCNYCDTKRFLEESETIGYHKKLHQLSKEEKIQFRIYGICPDCVQLRIDSRSCINCRRHRCGECNTSKDETWCDNCDAKRFWEESETLGYHKKLDQLSKDEKIQFKLYGICTKCIQLKIDPRSCANCMFGRCDECKQPYISEEKWCNDCDTKSFMVESRVIGYCKELKDLSKAEKFLFRQYGICHDCKQLNTGYGLCIDCYKSYSKCQECKRPYFYEEWCNFCDNKIFLEESKIIGCYKNLNDFTKDEKVHFKKYGICPDFALKEINLDSKMASVALNNEINIHNLCQNSPLSTIIRFYGISKNPNTGNFIMVLEYAEDGSLRESLDRSFQGLTWKKKLEMMKTIVDNLETIHNLDLIHRDLHHGNILQLSSGKLSICDLGLSQSIYEIDKYGVYGVLPYMAPEILRGQRYTKASDIYGFGIIAYEIITGLPPYHDIDHNYLALPICGGLRPKFNIKVPQSISDLINKCLDANPLERPTANELSNQLFNLINDSSNEGDK